MTKPNIEHCSDGVEMQQNNHDTNMSMKDTIGEDGCACGDYESDNLIAKASCRKSGSSPSFPDYVAHRLVYTLKNEYGTSEIGELINRMLYYGADGVVVECEGEAVE